MKKNEYSSYEGIIKSLASRWHHELKKRSFNWEYEDLEQEGWVAYSKCCNDDKFDPSRSSFTTFLYLCVNDHYKQILAFEQRVRRKDSVNSESMDEKDFDYLESSYPDPEKLAMFHEALFAISEVSTDFVKMIIDGIPKDLLRIAKSRMRNRLYSRGFNPANGTVRLEKSMVESFFSINIDDLKKLFYNYS